MNILYYAVISMCVSFCIGIMLNSRMKIAALGAVLGGMCYGGFILCGSSRLGYFVGTLILTLLSEFMAKRVKTPSTLFLIIGIYPLVPGSGIYKTFMQIIEADYAQALITGGDTFVNIAIMTTVIALVSTIFGKSSEEIFNKSSKMQPNLFEKGGNGSDGKIIY